MRFFMVVLLLVLARFAVAEGEAKGSVEGDIVLHGRPLAGATVMLMRQLVQPAPASRQSTTNSAGHFSFENVPPGEYAVGHMVMSEVRGEDWSSKSGTDSYRRQFVLESGQHLVLPPYPKGHRLTGRMVLPPGSTYDVAWQAEDMRHIYTPRADDGIPEGLSPEEYARRFDVYRKTKRFKKDWEKGTRIVLTVFKDGTFWADDVPPGKYVLNIDVGENREPKRGQLPAVAYTTFKMPDKDFTLPDVVVHEPKQN